VISTREGIPFVHTEHSSGYATNVYSESDLYVTEDVVAASAQTIAVSQALADEIRSVVSGKDIDIIPNMVDTNRFTLPPQPRSSDPFTFIAIARLKRKKGVHVLVEAFCQEFSSQENVRLEIAGNGPEEENLRRKVKGRGLEKNICFRGLLSRPEIRNLMWEGNVLVSPSFVETFGIVIIEAASTGLPIIATRSGGPEEIVTNEMGWLTEPGDIEELRDAMRRAYEADEELEKREEKIRGITERNYSRQEVSEQLIKVYEEALERG
jgi:glycosyltransferase involved in cell wall biosynthesis